MTSFWEKLNGAIAQNQSLLVLSLDPNPELLPQQQWDLNHKQDENLIANWLELIIAQTSDLVCAYQANLGFYLSLGAKGLVLLDRIIKAIPTPIPIVLDAKHGDLNSSTIFARTIFENWQVDAVTLSPYIGQDHAAPFLVYPDKAVFVLCRSSNQGAITLQEYPNREHPVYLELVKEAKNWGTPEQLCLEVGTTSIEVLTKIRKIAPERIILTRSIWGEGGNLDAILRAGLNNNGDGLLIPVPIDLLARENRRDTISLLKDEINLVRNQVREKVSSCDLWMPDVCLLENLPYQDLILQLYDIGCILFGEYVQASGQVSSHYIDLRKIISNPQIFHRVLTAYGDILKTLEFDRIAGIPYGSLPTATGLALDLNCPMIFPRKEVKAHGTRRLIEGNFTPGEKVVVVDDILITGNSAIEGAEKIKSAGLIVEDIVVFIDAQEGAKDRLRQDGYRAISVLTISEITKTLYQAGRIEREQFALLNKNQASESTFN